jgi:hypothetical protein
MPLSGKSLTRDGRLRSDRWLQLGKQFFQEHAEETVLPPNTLT